MMMEVVSSEIELRRGGIGRKRSDSLPSIPTAGFPAKSITRHTNRGKSMARPTTEPVKSFKLGLHLKGHTLTYYSGQWIIAYQAEQRKRLKTSLVPAIDPLRSQIIESGRLTAPKNTPASTSAKYHKTFDKQLLLKIGYVSEPQDLCVINVSGLELTRFNDDYFGEFTCLESVCASDNRLPLEAFEAFINLQDLELSLNSITDLSITPDTFTNLTKLDLSYNNLSSAAIIALGMLKELEELHLTGNNIVYLPIEMSQLQPAVELSSHRSDRTSAHTADESIMINFPKLEKLWLDSNHITDTGTFAILAGLRKLQYLNLDDNHLSCIPRLKLSRTYNSLSAGQEDTTDLTTTTDTTTNNSASTRPMTQSSALRMAPFPRLHTLSLADNMIISADNLIGCDVWPTLTTLIIAGNPIVNLNKGLPPLVQQELVDIAGISVLRTRPESTSKHRRSYIGIKAKDFIKVSTAPPPLIPKTPILLALEPPPFSPPSLTPSEYYEDQQDEEEFGFSEESSLSGSTSLASERASVNNNETGQNIFMTQPPQVDDNEDLQEHIDTPTDIQDTKPQIKVPETKPTLNIREELKRRRKEAIERNKSLPDKYKGYEYLLETPEDDQYYDGPPLPSDTRACARALRHVLRNPLQLTDATKASLKAAKTVVKEPDLHDSAQYMKRTPVRTQYDDTPATSRREVVIETLIDDMLTHETTIESNLADMLMAADTPSGYNVKRKSEKQKQKNEEKLLNNLQKKFDEVCQTSLQTISALEGVQKVLSQQ